MDTFDYYATHPEERIKAAENFRASSKRDITHYYRLKSLCKKLSSMKGIVESDKSEDLVADIAHAAINAQKEALESYIEFCYLPHVRALFDAFMEEKYGAFEDEWNL